MAPSFWIFNTFRKRSNFFSNGGTLQTFTLLSHVLKSGELQLFTNDEKVLALKAKNQRIDLNIVDNKFLKDVLRDSVDVKSFLKNFAYFKNIAEELKNENVTITVSFKGIVVLTLGSDAKPNLSRLITRTTEVEINNLRKLIQMGL